MFALLDRISRRIVRRGLRQGLLEGSSLWLVAGTVAWLFRLLTTPESPRVVRERIAVGESIVVTHLPAPPTVRAARRATRRAAGATAGEA
ncbi:MAG TPA: hypothetical protein VND23_07320 [Acidimicrobiales bacterium]|nr:hypothetical protein [Acidimicrobiales bacterium]